MLIVHADLFTDSILLPLGYRFKVSGKGCYTGDLTADFTIGKADITATEIASHITAPTPKDGLSYTGNSQALLSAAGKVTGGFGTMLYSLDGSNWKADIADITGKEAQTYTVYYKVKGGDNYNDFEDNEHFQVSVTIKAVYTITFKNSDGSILSTVGAVAGTVPVYNGTTTPTKAADKTYTDTFNGGWTPAIGAASENATYTATYDAEVNCFDYSADKTVFEYNENEQKPVLTVFTEPVANTKFNLTENVDYEVQWQTDNFIDYGDRSSKIVGLGDFAGTRQLPPYLRPQK